jgi:hypothetical protein
MARCDAARIQPGVVWRCGGALPPAPLGPGSGLTGRATNLPPAFAPRATHFLLFLPAPLRHPRGRCPAVAPSEGTDGAATRGRGGSGGSGDAPKAGRLCCQPCCQAVLRHCDQPCTRASRVGPVGGVGRVARRVLSPGPCPLSPGPVDPVPSPSYELHPSAPPAALPRPCHAIMITTLRPRRPVAARGPVAAQPATGHRPPSTGIGPDLRGATADPVARTQRAFTGCRRL